YTLRHSFTYYQNHFAGGLARKISEGIEKIPNLSTQIRWEILLPIINMSASCLILFKVSWLYASSICILLFAILLPVLVKLKKLQVKTQRFADVRSKVTGQIVDTISNIAVVKSFANEAHEMDEHRAVSEEEMAAWHKMLRVFLLLDNYRRLVLVCFGGGMAVACVIGWQHGVITIGEIATIMGITFNFTGLVWSMSFGIVHAAESLGYLNDSLDTITRPHHITDKPDAQDLQVTKGEIAYRDVTFEYASNPVFEGLSLTIAPQERIGLIGPSGAGKTTLVNLLQRFFDVQHGTIRIDGQNIADMTQHSLRKALSFIPQDTTLFHRSLKDNIRYGKLDASDEEVIAAAKTAHAHEFITELPEGYDTLVGERGVKLSGGQRQRIAIARAILKNAPILILDEATSALDSESEQRIQEGLQTLMQGRTVIAIAHRLSTINHLDRLVVMDQGQIVEEGSHKQLLRKKGLYARLWDMQSGGFLPE
ncbi:MAG: ABC transporter ATP-binding protein, partial [Rickettsiales bacterium]